MAESEKKADVVVGYIGLEEITKAAADRASDCLIPIIQGVSNYVRGGMLLTDDNIKEPIFVGVFAGLESEIPKEWQGLIDELKAERRERLEQIKEEKLLRSESAKE